MKKTIKDELTFGELLRNLEKCSTYDQAYIMFRPYAIRMITDKVCCEDKYINYIFVEDGIYMVYDKPDKIEVESVMFEEDILYSKRWELWMELENGNYETRLEKWNNFMKRKKVVLY